MDHVPHLPLPSLLHSFVLAHPSVSLERVGVLDRSTQIGSLGCRAPITAQTVSRQLAPLQQRETHLYAHDAFVGKKHTAFGRSELGFADRAVSRAGTKPIWNAWAHTIASVQISSPLDP